MKFYAKGKLLLTAEYAVLGGAKALALPTKLGQSLEITQTTTGIITWKSVDANGQLWYENSFDKKTFAPQQQNDAIGERLQQLFLVINEVNPTLLADTDGLFFVSSLEFNRSWGLGSSSTLVSLLAQWSEVNPYVLLQKVFGGSGYDIACATADGALLYERTNAIHPTITAVDFNPCFKDQLFFVHLNQKQDSQQAVVAFDNGVLTPQKMKIINGLTQSFLSNLILMDFQELMTQHEAIIASLINATPIQKLLFNDYPGTIKSLGAWGGDFILACGAANTPDYFAHKGYKTCLTYQSLVG
ncbi:MAG: GYDIA family GHMP kinase [Flavobacteriaceae bacterium]|nr:GHMP kinase [Flavobacteriaceae bacterium]|tara:strand:+ start:7196 stop:8095 length:900 start_codon:yes stop_codon:yes gene_type:complete